MIPRIQFTDNGLVPPTRQEISNALWNMFREAFGSDLNPDPRTPQGQLVTSLTAALVDNNDSMIELGNQFDPRFATGVWQEALGAIHLQSTGVFTVDASLMQVNCDIKATGDITDNSADQAQSMSSMRAVYNSHTHNENDSGGPTDPPNQEM